MMSNNSESRPSSLKTNRCANHSEIDQIEACAFAVTADWAHDTSEQKARCDTPTDGCTLCRLSSPVANQPHGVSAAMSRSLSQRILILTPLAAMTLASVAGCSSLQPPPMMPSYPAPVGGSDGVSWELDSKCRGQAYRLAEQARRSNINREVGYTLIGIAAGVAIGSALSYDVEPRYPPGRRYHWHHGGYPYTGYRRDYRGAGGVAGAATGAVLSQSAMRDPQRVYDVVYENCIRNNWGYGQ
ncbi:hypothetical protein [Thiorhodococcus drewsii]|nr:hypothetical protein [Thiorhodococcus drewsii]